MASFSMHGTPCWYELTTPDLEGAAAFYGKILGWSFEDSGMPGYTYHLVKTSAGDLVAGASMPEAGSEQPPTWLIYYAVADADASVDKITQLGGTIVVLPQHVPGTGRFAICLDPQGAAFGILEPEPMNDDETPPSPYAHDKIGHGRWHELMTPDPEAGFAFYAEVFGWTAGDAIDMGPEGKYQLLLNQDDMFGGLMGLGDSPLPYWMPYFAANDFPTADALITDAGGKVIYGPAEVPGGQLIVIGEDPAGAHFAVISA